MRVVGYIPEKPVKVEKKTEKKAPQKTPKKAK